jgi:hypothetical protein
MKKLFLMVLFGAKVFGQSAPLYVGEKTYLHTDRNQYVAGDTLWLKAYLLNAQTHEFSTLSQVLYVALLDTDKKPVIEQTLLLKNAQSSAALSLSTFLQSGRYQLVAYTNLMQNQPADFFYHQTIEVFDRATINQTTKPNTAVSADWSVQFFPEGGNLIAELNNKVAFKATNTSGRSCEIEGILKDENGEVVTNFKTDYLGMGLFTFKPIENHIYRATVTHQGQTKTVTLPNILKSGLSLSVDNVIHKNGILMQVSNQSVGAQKMFLTAQMRGQVLFEEAFEQNQTAQQFILENAKIPQDGIVQITLFDSQHSPVCERLAFVKQRKPLTISIKTTQQNPEPRQKIQMDIQATDAEGKPVAADLSLAVTDDGQVGGNADQPNFYSYLLLNSDLKGYIEKPNAYFEMDNLRSKLYLDYLMLTQGWRRFVWKELAQQKQDYEVEKSLVLVGRAYKRETTFANKEIWFNVWDKLKMQVVIAKTDSTGHFEIANTWADSVKILATDNRGHNLRLELQNTVMDYEKIGNLTIQPSDNKDVGKLIENSLTMQEMKLQDGVFLNEVTIKEKRDILKNDGRRLMYNGEPDISIEITKEMTSVSSVAQMLEGKLVGVRYGSFDPTMGSVNTLHSDENAITNRLLILLDGVVIDRESLKSIRPTDVERVDLLRDVSKTAIYGIRVGDGKVVNILTKRGVTNNRSTIVNRPQARWLGYALEREFYSPQYNQTNPQTRPDYRATLYWNAHVVTDKDGKATVTFYNSDIAKKLNIIVEGTDGLGNVGNGSIVVR